MPIYRSTHTSPKFYFGNLNSNHTHQLFFLKKKNKILHITYTPWKFYFDGSVCDDERGIGAVLISPSGAVFEFSNRLEEYCTNNQVKYEALLFGLEIL